METRTIKYFVPDPALFFFIYLHLNFAQVVELVDTLL